MSISFNLISSNSKKTLSGILGCVIAIWHFGKVTFYYAHSFLPFFKKFYFAKLCVHGSKVFLVKYISKCRISLAKLYMKCFLTFSFYMLLTYLYIHLNVDAVPYFHITSNHFL